MAFGCVLVAARGDRRPTARRSLEIMYDIEDDRGVPVTTGIPKLVNVDGARGRGLDLRRRRDGARNRRLQPRLAGGERDQHQVVV